MSTHTKAGFLGRVLYKLFGSRNDRVIKQLLPAVERINAREPAMRRLSDKELGEQSALLRARFKAGETLDQLLEDAFAACREASRRALGMRHFDVQLIGGMILHQGKIAEMVTGEGKTLVATLAAYLNALEGRSVHVVTVNDYLARRDRDWNAPLFELLGMKVGCIQSHMEPEDRIEQYACDVTYGTNSELGFDYLRDNMKVRLEWQCQRERRFAIVDEVDSVLVDEARTPLIISGPAENNPAKYTRANDVAKQLIVDEHFEVKEKEHQCLLTEEGVHAAERIAGVESFYSGANMEWPHLVETALRAHHIYKRDVSYMVDQGKIKIVDEFTGRPLAGRRWSDGLHQAIEAKEGVRIENESQTLATITYQNFFRLYDKLAGMTGTAMTEAAEFDKIYGLDVVAVPTNRPLIRENYDDVIYVKESKKYEAMVEEIVAMHEVGRPVLVGTTSIEKSERISGMLERRGIKHQVLNAKHHEREAMIVAQAGQMGAVTIATNMAGRGTDIVLGPGVADLGGLHIVGTERHESRRIDNQLRGRSGRQGDRGSSRFFLSLEDDLMRIFAGPMVRGLIERLDSDGMDIQHPWLTRSIEKAQKKVEAHNFEIRKNILEYDKVMDEQRKIVYGLRQRVLCGEGTKDEILHWFDERAEQAVDLYLPETARSDDWDVEGLEEFLATRFELKITEDEIDDLTAGDRVRPLIEHLQQKIRALYEERERGLGPEEMRSLERFIMLNAIDHKWKDHLHAVDCLRDGISLEAYGGKDPKVIYKSVAYQYFDQMLDSIREEVTEMLFRLKIEAKDEARLERTFNATEYQHGGEAGSSGYGDANKGASTGTENVAHTIRRKGKKVGRNDPCPCGSGRKYKKCCGQE